MTFYSIVTIIVAIIMVSLFNLGVEPPL